MLPDPEFNSAVIIRPTFILLAITEQFGRLSLSLGRRVQPDQDAAHRAMWNSYTRYIIEHLRILNVCIQNKGNVGGRTRVFYLIGQLLSFDVIVQATEWPAHMNGYFAYVEYLGGVDAVLNLEFAPFRSFSHVMG